MSFLDRVKKEHVYAKMVTALNVYNDGNDFLVRTGLRSGVSELQLPCFTAVRAEIALMSGGAFAVTHHPVSS